MKKQLIITLLNISGVSRKTVVHLIENGIDKNLMIDKLDVRNIQLIFTKSRITNKKIPLPTIESIEEALVKSENIMEESLMCGINSICILDEDFPKCLKELKDPPVIIYYKGNINCINNEKAVAIVGSRNATIHGFKISQRLGAIFAQDDYVVISGLAKGIDEAAHMGCLKEKGKTIAVLPSGLDNIYPASNKKLTEDILKNNGCIISEYQVGTEVFKNYFIERDRLQSALSKAVIVVETTITGGTMYTANYALEQNKILACYKPEIGFKNNYYLQGNIKLINEKCAMELNHSSDIEKLKERITKEKELSTLSIEKKETFQQTTLF